MKKKVWLLFLVMLSINVVQAQNTKVYLIPTLHSFHKTNQKYNYDSLKAVINRTHPDVIAVEIRQEDMDADSDYLSKNYPYEMWMPKYWFPQTQLEGFDWLGEEIENIPIPENYWKFQSVIKQLERNLIADSAASIQVARCQPYEDERMNILQNNSLKEIYNSNDVILTKSYYDCLALQLQNTRYAALPEFYGKRNTKMGERIDAILKENTDKIIVLLTGDDHYPFLREHLQKMKVTVLQPQ